MADGGVPGRVIGCGVILALIGVYVFSAALLLLYVVRQRHDSVARCGRGRRAAAGETGGRPRVRVVRTAVEEPPERS